MKTQMQTKPTEAKPFVLCFLEQIDQAVYDEAIQGSKILKDSYDSETQTSSFPLCAGTSLTYSDSYSGGIWPFTNSDDTKQSDT